MTSYLKHNHAYGNNLTGGSSDEKEFTPRNLATIDATKIIIVDAKSVLFGSTKDWDKRELPRNNNDWKTGNRAGTINTPGQILYNICIENPNHMVYVLTDYYNESHFKKFNKMVVDNPGTYPVLGTTITAADGITNLTIKKYTGGNKHQKMNEILKDPIGTRLIDNDGKVIYVTRNYHGGNSPESINKNNTKQADSINQTIIKINPTAKVTVEASTAHIPSDIFYKHYLKSPTQLMYKSSSDMLQSYSNASTTDISYGPFMKSPQTYKRDNQWLWPPKFDTNPIPTIETGTSYTDYINDPKNEPYNKLFRTKAVNNYK